MRRLIVFAILSIAAPLLAQDASVQKNNPAADPASAPCTVTGRVVATADGNPLKGARVALIPEHSHARSQMYATTSNGDGNFSMKNISPGRYSFFASQVGFVEQHYKAGNNDTGSIFSLHPGEKVSDVLFQLTAAAVITGRVSNEDGDPMQRVELVALRRPTEEETEDSLWPRKIQMEPVASAESDDRGQYRIFGLKPGEYYLRAEDSARAPDGPVPVDDSFWLTQSLGSEYANVYYPGFAQISQAQMIPIKAGEEAQADVIMHRFKTVEVAGRVIGGSGPAANALVELESVDANGSEFDRQDTTDDKGNFRLRNVPEGTYYVVVDQRDPGTRVYESRAREKIEVAAENIDSLTITLGGGATIEGKLKLDGAGSVALDQIRLILMPINEDSLPGGHSDVKKDGSFEMRSVPDGSFSLFLWGLDRDAYVKSIRFGPDDVMEKGVQVEGGTVPGKIEVTISSDGAKLDGSVSDGEGPMIGARVRLVPDPLTPYNHLRLQHTTTDQLGHFAVSAIAPGKYTLTAKPMASGESTSYKSEPQSLSLSANDHQTIELKFEKQQQ